VRHRQDHVVLVLVLEPAHLGPDLVPAPALLPDVRWMHDRHGDLLAPDRVHLFSQDPLDLGHRAARQV